MHQSIRKLLAVSGQLFVAVACTFYLFKALNKDTDICKTIGFWPTVVCAPLATCNKC